MFELVSIDQCHDSYASAGCPIDFVPAAGVLPGHLTIYRMNLMA